MYGGYFFFFAAFFFVPFFFAAFFFAIPITSSRCFGAAIEPPRETSRAQALTSRPARPFARAPESVARRSSIEAPNVPSVGIATRSRIENAISTADPEDGNHRAYFRAARAAMGE